MKMRLVFAIVAGMLLSLTGAAIAQPITVGNFSFEEPCTVKQYNWQSVPNWNSDTVANDSGVDIVGNGNTATDGEWFGFLWNADPSVYNLTDRTIAGDETFILTVDATNGYTSDSISPFFKMTLYYDNAGSRVPVASRTFTLPGTYTVKQWCEYSIEFNADSAPASIGKKIGIELENTTISTTTSWVLMDNVRLERSLVSNPSPINHTTFVAVTTNLSWDLDLSADKCDVYFGTNPNVTANPKVIDGVRQTSYNPPGDLDPEAIYFWRVDTYVGETLYEGYEREFTTAPAGAPEEDVYYINSTYGNDSDSGTINEPWQTLAKANTTLQAGDTVYIRGGVYTQEQINPANSGTSGNPITYQNYSSEEVIVSGGHWGFPLLDISGNSYVKVIGMKFRWPRYRWGTIVNSDHIYITDCTFDKVKPSITGMAYDAYWIEDSDQIYHTNCLWTMEDQTSDSDGYTMRTQDLTHSKFDGCTFGNTVHATIACKGGGNESVRNYVVIKNCVSYCEWHSQIAIGGVASQPWLVENNIVYNSGKNAQERPLTISPSGIHPAFYVSTINSIIRKNVLYNNGTNLFFRAPDNRDIPQNNWVYNNTIYNTNANDYFRDLGLNKGSGTFIYSESGNASNPDFDILREVHILNNIFWKSEGNMSDRDFYATNVYGGRAPYDNVIKYNLFGDPGKTIRGLWQPYWTETVEWLENNDSQWIDDTHILEKDPQFTDADNQDFRLLPDSPAIDSGIWLTAITSATADNQISIILETATPFYSGSGFPWLIEGETGDTIKTENGQITTIQSIDYDTNTITISPAIDIVNGEGVALEYGGSAPDMGAFEFTGVACLPIDQADWSLLYVDSEELVEDGGYPAENSFDGNPDTFWSTKWSLPDPEFYHPHEIQIDLGGFYDICGFRYLPRQDDGPGDENGMINEYEFYVSGDSDDWGAAVATGTFAKDKTEKQVSFDHTLGQYIRLVAISEVNGNPWTTMAELNVLAVQPDSDINDDGKVNIEDFAVLSMWWDDENACSTPSWCGGADFDMSGVVDFTDLTYFVENWLRQAD